MMFPGFDRRRPRMLDQILAAIPQAVPEPKHDEHRYVERLIREAYARGRGDVLQAKSRV